MKFPAALSCLLVTLLLGGCTKSTPRPRVVLYCSVDEEFAKPIINQLAVRTGLQIDTLYDVEAAKTAGLANRIRAEKPRPRGDVFWSSALLQTLLLQREGLLQPYISSSANDIPKTLKDTGGQWTAMAVRMHTLRYRKGLKDPPITLRDLLQPRFKNHVGLSDPQFGTGADWLAVLGVRLGDSATLKLIADLKANGLKVLPGNSVVADGLDKGDLLAGLADGDDWDGKANTVPAPGTDMGVALPVPGSVAILRGAPHLQAAQKLVDALVSLETEKLLVKQVPGSFSARPQEEPAAIAKAVRSLPAPTAEVAAWDTLREPAAHILLGSP